MYDEAIRDFRALWRLNPREPRFVLGLGMAYVGKNDAQAAIKLFDQLIAHNPADAQALYGRALAYRQLGQQAASLRDLDQAIKIQPQNPQYTRMRETFAAQKQ
jgi:tetratricopeptide (TPR) repeat protein